MSSPSGNYYASKLFAFSRQPFSVQWRAAMVRLPWLVPQSVLRFTSPEGPHPELLYIPSRRGPSVQIPVYVFVPPRPAAAAEVGEVPWARLPVHLDFHGGGFIMGSCLEQAPWCSRVARETGRVVVTVDYRKGPLDKFPAALEDAEDVLAAVLDVERRTEPGRLLHAHVAAKVRVTHQTPENDGGGGSVLDPDRVSLSGFSSGGNLALNLVLSVRHDGGKERWPSLFADDGPKIPTLLFYPSFDSTLLPHERPLTEKMRRLRQQEGGGKKSDSGSWFASLGSVLGPTYLPAEMRKHPRASPGLNGVRECLSARSRVFLVLPEMDTLAVQSDEWLEKVRSEGLQGVVDVHREQDMPHGWTQFPDRFLDAKQKERKYAVFDEAIAFIQRIGLQAKIEKKEMVREENVEQKAK